MSTHERNRESDFEWFHGSNFVFREILKHAKEQGLKIYVEIEIL